MAKFETTFVRFSLAGLLILSIFLFGVSLQIDNHAPETMLDNSLLNESFGDLESDLGGFRDSSQNQRQLFEEEKPTTGFGSLILFSIVSSGKVFTSMTIGVFNLLINLPMVLFGVSPIIASVLSTILLVGVILGLWVLYKLGG